jgi:Protein ENHANCED DISEASE RESISTANCE 2, C-terminal
LHLLLRSSSLLLILLLIYNSYGTSVEHIASQGACAKRIASLTSGENAPFLFVTAIQVPGTPLLYLVMYWAVDPVIISLGQTLKATVKTPTVAAVTPSKATSIDNSNNTYNSTSSTASSSSSSINITGVDVNDSGVKAFARLLHDYINLPIEDVPVSQMILNDDTNTLDLRGMTPVTTPTAATAAASGSISSISAANTPKSQQSSPTNSRKQTFYDNPYHNSRFKLIPKVVDGPFIVRKAVGSTPCLLGTKVLTRYYRGDNYMETNIEVMYITNRYMIYA